MSDKPSPVEDSLNRHFLQAFPAEAALQLETMKVEDILPSLTALPARVLTPVWSRLVPRFAAELTLALPGELAKQVLTEIPPNLAGRILSQMREGQRRDCLELLDATTRFELTQLMSYPENSAGRLMNTRVPTFHGSMKVEEALNALRDQQAKVGFSVFIVDIEGRLTALVSLQDLALADPGARLDSLAQPVRAIVQVTASGDEVADLFSRRRLPDLPVVDINGVLLGVIVHSSLMRNLQEDTSADIQTMVGVSREERALSSPLFAVKKRNPWLQVNLITAFMAASVVGLFENTIAQFTVLAVLLPVVAGQSGNSGAQALAVTMRGLALREITIRHWFTVMYKEVRAGFLNGLGIALTCGIGVYLWSGSPGLVAVISLAMVLAMVGAGFAGAVVPIALVRLGQDPAQASSIILTTVTDIVGFFAFLGIATLMMSYL